MDENIILKEQITMFGSFNPSQLFEESCEDSNKVILRNTINLRTELINEIPNTTYLTHGIHNVYPAKFIPQVPRFVIKKFNLTGKIILDPFAGSGTTAVESVITGNSNISNDINPLTKFLIQVKTLRLNPKNYFKDIDRLIYHVNSIFKCSSKFIPKWGNLSYWYPKEILDSLCKIWGYIHKIDENENNIKNILKVSALYLSRKYSYGEDESPKLFKSKQKLERIKELENSFRKVGEALLQNELLKKSKQYFDSIIYFNSMIKNDYNLLDSLDNSQKQFLMVLNNSIEELTLKLPEKSIDCIITSPPYIYAQEYFRSTKIDMYWLDMINDELVRKLTRKEIGQKSSSFYDLSSDLSKIEPYIKTLMKIKKLSENFKTKSNMCRFTAYFNDIFYFITVSKTLLTKKGILAIFIGEPKVFGNPVNVKDIISEMLTLSDFKVIYTFFDIIKSRHLSKNRLNENPDGISGEWLIIGEKL